ncbi:dystrophin-like isoform X2 [Chrysoperla carnea]|uniref:dystrophin-like isoform X2 n=1 Tax=Chrysoperla carnea TaxID=189513 RepID=UPI001D095918|nr:dystrophin-like isoform X2 [Chrysoperla carnea]
MQNPWQRNDSLSISLYNRNEACLVNDWHHPKNIEIRRRLDECNIIRYAAYRVAAKLRILQHSMQTNNLPLTLCASIFTKHRLGSTEASLLLECCELEAVLYDIFFAAQKHGLPIDNVDEATSIMVMLLYNIYDKNKEGKIPVIAAKICMAVLCNSTLSDVYRYFYTLIADHNNCVTRRRLQTLLNYLATITEFLQEGSMFGQSLVDEAIEKCFTNSSGVVGIDEDSFMRWLQDTPPILSWLTTFNRLRVSENVTHNIKCSSCKQIPIVGLRYKCMRCVRYTQCQTCYFTACVSHNHKLKHPMQEHCKEDSSSEVTHAFLKRLRKLVRCSHSKSHNLNDTKESSHLLPSIDEKDKSVISDTASSPINSIEEHLSTIIHQLEQQNNQLQQQINSLRSGSIEKEILRSLEEHRSQVGTQVQKLKLLKQVLQKKNEISDEIPAMVQNRNHIDIESTPMIPSTNKRIKRIGNATGFNLFSPIVMTQEQTEPSATYRSSIDERSSSVVNHSQNPFLSDSGPTCSIQDLSTWIGGRPTNETTKMQSTSQNSISRIKEKDSDLDAVLEKLHEILANNMTFDGSEILSTIELL